MATTLPPDIDELSRYVFHNYAWLMTLEEKAAHKAFMLEAVPPHSPKEKRAHLRERMEFSNPGMAKLLEGDASGFFVSTGVAVFLVCVGGCRESTAHSAPCLVRQIELPIQDPRQQSLVDGLGHRPEVVRLGVGLGLQPLDEAGSIKPLPRGGR